MTRYTFVTVGLLLLGFVTARVASMTENPGLAALGFLPFAWGGIRLGLLAIVLKDELPAIMSEATERVWQWRLSRQARQYPRVEVREVSWPIALLPSGKMEKSSGWKAQVSERSLWEYFYHPKYTPLLLGNGLVSFGGIVLAESGFVLTGLALAFLGLAGLVVTTVFATIACFRPTS